VYYYGNTSGGPIPTKEVSSVVKAGEQMNFVLSSGGAHGINATPGFQGYLVIECDFPNARGYATDGPIGQCQVASGYNAEIIHYESHIG
jgi:hypothetical protein